MKYVSAASITLDLESLHSKNIAAVQNHPILLDIMNADMSRPRLYLDDDAAC
jgi:hypothetical protein